MKKILLFSLLMFSLQVYGQKTITYEDMKTITKGTQDKVWKWKHRSTVS